MIAKLRTSCIYKITCFKEGIQKLMKPGLNKSCIFGGTNCCLLFPAGGPFKERGQTERANREGKGGGDPKQGGSSAGSANKGCCLSENPVIQ